MSLSFTASVHEHYDEAGRASLFGVSTSNRYQTVRGTQIQSLSMDKRISSVVVYPSSLVDGTVILFLDPKDYSGRFVQITNQKDSGVNQAVHQLSAFDFDNDTRSILLVGPNRDDGFDVRLSFRDLFLEKWKVMLDAQLNGTDAKRRGDPILSWEVFPLDVSHLDPSAKYLRIHQNLKIDPPNWAWDYDASMTYHIYLYLDGAGKLKGYVRRWAYKVESGLLSDEIGDRLRPQVISGVDTLNAELARELEVFSSFTFSDLYYLPGNQTTRPPSGVMSGNTFDDATIVLEL
jgi:hypothetical protein